MVSLNIETRSFVFIMHYCVIIQIWCLIKKSTEGTSIVAIIVLQLKYKEFNSYNNINHNL